MRAHHATAIPVIFINLDDDDERRRRMEAQLDRIGATYERMPAVSGLAMTESEIAETCPSRKMWWRGMPLSEGEIGCFRSHLAALEHIAAGPDPAVCVLEDDVALGDELGKLLRDIDIPPGVGIAKLEGSSGPVPRLGMTVGRFGDRSLRVYGLPKWRTGAYIVTRRAAKQLRDRMREMYGPLDQMIFEPWRTGVMVAEMRPFPLHQVGPSGIDHMTGRKRSRDVREFLLLAWRLARGHIWMLRHMTTLLGMRLRGGNDQNR